jgi:hypothetical protein
VSLGRAPSLPAFPCDKFATPSAIQNGLSRNLENEAGFSKDAPGIVRLGFCAFASMNMKSASRRRSRHLLLE